jgi:predicted nuclease of predicted toxin-antitoxin system
VIRFLLDADLPRSATQALRDRGREALDIRDVGLGDAPDDAIYRYAVAHGYVLVSADKASRASCVSRLGHIPESSSSVSHRIRPLTRRFGS